MTCPHRSASSHWRRQRGLSLAESLVAFVVLALGTAAAAHLQGQLRLAGDVARERSEAIRFGQAANEDMRSFAAIDGAPGERSFTDIVSGDASVTAASLPGAHADYRIERRVDDLAFGAATATRVAVRWRDRGGNEARGRAALAHRRHCPGLRRLAGARDRRGPERAKRRLRARTHHAADRAQTRRSLLPAPIVQPSPRNATRPDQRPSARGGTMQCQARKRSPVSSQAASPRSAAVASAATSSRRRLPSTRERTVFLASLKQAAGAG